MYERTPRGGVRPFRGVGDVYLQTPRGSTRRFRGVGDGPVTSPDQDPTTGEIQMPDDYVGSGPAPSTFDSGSDQTVATVGPIITGVKNAVTSTVDWLKGALTGDPGPVTTTVTGTGPAASAAGAGSSGPNLLVLAALGGVGYYAYKHVTKKKRR